MNTVHTLLVALLGAIGLSCLGLVLASLRTRKIWGRRKSSDPRRPWRAYENWSSGFSFPAVEDARAIKIAWLVGAGNALLAAGLIWAAHAEGFLPQFTVAMDVYGLAVLAAFGVALCRQARLRRHGLARLVLEEFPIVPGRSLVGAVVCAKAVPVVGLFRIRLKCTRTMVGAESPLSNVLLECQREVQPAPAGNRKRTVVPLNISIPEELPSKTDPGEMPDVRWTLTVAADTNGLAFEAAFDLPVYRVADVALIERNAASEMEGLNGEEAS